jgi:hypothetical protein
MKSPSDLQRYGYFPREIKALAENVGEFARDANNALKRRVLGYTKTVERFSATGSTATQIPLTASDRPPVGVVLIRAIQTDNAGVAIAAVPILSFYYANGAIGVFEPSGLTANTSYNLTFLVVEE